MALHGIALVLALVQGQAAPAAARLSSPDVLPHEFSLIRGLRELPDGRVVVSDWIEEVVAVADFRSGSVR